MNGITNEYWYPMHTHDDYKVTNFGEYPGGQLSIIHVVGAGSAAADSTMETEGSGATQDGPVDIGR